MEICAVISDNEKAYGLQRAKDENIKTFSLKDNINDDLNKCYEKILGIIKFEKEGLSQKQDLSEIKRKIDELIE